jgi:hypothetical protein
MQPIAWYSALEARHIEILGHMKRAYWINNRLTLADVETGGAIGEEF